MSLSRHTRYRRALAAHIRGLDDSTEEAAGASAFTDRQLQQASPSDLQALVDQGAISQDRADQALAYQEEAAKSEGSIWDKVGTGLGLLGKAADVGGKVVDAIGKGAKVTQTFRESPPLQPSLTPAPSATQQAPAARFAPSPAPASSPTFLERFGKRVVDNPLTIAGAVGSLAVGWFAPAFWPVPALLAVGAELLQTALSKE